VDGKKKVLVVDDDADFVEQVRGILEANGYEVDVAYNGTECLAKVEAAPPDLILLDIRMSTWSEGFEVADKLHESETTKGIPILLVSSVDLRGAFELERGAEAMVPTDGYLVKPVEPDNLLQHVAMCMEHKAAAKQGPAPQGAEAPVVLLIDDDADFLAMNRAVLEANGYRVECAVNAAEAREVMERVTPDVVITDLMMETLLSGFLFTQQIRQNPKFKNVPIVVVTAIRTSRGLAFTPKEGELAAAGIDGYFEKPIKPDQLLAKVQGLLKGSAGAGG